MPEENPTPQQQDRDPKSELEWANWVNAWYRYGVTHRKAWLEEREKCVKALYDEQDKPKSDEIVWVRLNQIRPIIRKILGRMIVNKPLPTAMGRSEQDEALARVIEALHEWKVDRDQTTFQFVACHRWQHQSGIGIGKEIFDPDKDDGLGELSPISQTGSGDLVFERVREDNMVLDPKATPLFYDDSRFIIHAEMSSIKEIERDHSHVKGKLKKENEWEIGETKRIADAQSPGPGYERQTGENQGAMRPGEDPEGDEALVKECWFPKREEFAQVFIDGELQEEMDPKDLPKGAEKAGYIEKTTQPADMGNTQPLMPLLGGRPFRDEGTHLAPTPPGAVSPSNEPLLGSEEVGRAAFEPQTIQIPVEVVRRTRLRWWVITTCQDHVLQKAEESTYTHPHHPFVFFVHTPREDTPWPIGEVYALRRLDLAFNLVFGLIVAHAVRTQNATTIVKGSIGDEEKEKLNNMGTKAQTIFLGPTASVDTLDPPPPSPALDRLAEKLALGVEATSSMPEVRHGKTPWSGISGKAIAELAGESALAEVEVDQYSEAAYTRWFQMRVSNLQQFFILETAIRIVGEDGKTDWMPVNHEMQQGEEVPEEKQEAWTVTEREEEDGEGKAVVKRFLNDIGGPVFDVKYTVDTSKEKTKQERQQMMVELAKVQMVDQEAVLKELEVKGWQQIIERMAEQNQALTLGSQVLEASPEMVPLIQALLQRPDMIQSMLDAFTAVSQREAQQAQGVPQGVPEGAPQAGAAPGMEAA